MKFVYSYNTKENVRKEGTVCAASRDAAYSALKSSGIRPIRVDVAPGYWNRLIGCGKRWIAICALTIVASLSLVYARRTERRALPQNCEDRAQLYGDPAVIRVASGNGWAETFADEGEAWMARHAIPGVPCDCERRKDELARIATSLERGCRRDVVIASADLSEIGKMKRMVNGLKHELVEYLEDGGSVEKFMRRVDIRQRAEEGVLAKAKVDLRRMKDDEEWKRRNAELRAMGLPMIDCGDRVQESNGNRVMVGTEK